jgi:hypothetical protein
MTYDLTLWTGLAILLALTLTAATWLVDHDLDDIRWPRRPAALPLRPRDPAVRLLRAMLGQCPDHDDCNRDHYLAAPDPEPISLALMNWRLADAEALAVMARALLIVGT